MARIFRDMAPAPTSTPRTRWGDRFPIFLGVYFGCHLLIRLIISDTLTLDEAEQVLVSQAFQWGYSGQPPLYAWLQHLLFLLFGRNLLALALLKNGLLFLAYLFLWLTARRLWPDRKELTCLAVLSWLLIPQIVWEAQRDLSHSVMVLCLASATLFFVARALVVRQPRPRPSLLWYGAYGALMGLGALSKYNFVVFAGALNLSLLTLPSGRRILLNARILVTLLIAMGIAAPHMAWAVDHWEVAVRSLGKVDASAGNNRVVGLGILMMAGISFLTPLWVAWLGFFPSRFRAFLAPRQDRLSLLIQRYLLVLGGGLALGVLALGVGHVKERWMIPFLFLAPLYFFSGPSKEPPAEGRVRWFRRLALGAALLTLLVSSTRSILGPTLGITTRVNYPFNAVAMAIEESGMDRAVILAHNAWFAGNLLKRFPESRVFVPGYILPPPGRPEQVLVVWDAVRDPELPGELRADLRDRFGLEPREFSPVQMTFPYKFGAGRQATIAVLQVIRAPNSGVQGLP